jgi:hypothetical protein
MRPSHPTEIYDRLWAMTAMGQEEPFPAPRLSGLGAP